MPVFFDISRYLTCKYFDIVWGYPPHPRGPPKVAPQNRQTKQSINLQYTCPLYKKSVCQLTIRSGVEDTTFEAKDQGASVLQKKRKKDPPKKFLGNLQKKKRRPSREETPIIREKLGVLRKKMSSHIFREFLPFFKV